MLYIFNIVVVTRLELKLPLTFISESVIHNITASFRILFKHKLSMNKCSPNALLTNPLIYNYRDLYDAQIQAKVSNLVTQLNDTSIVGRTTVIRVRNLQYKYCLHKSPLEEWPFDKTHDFKDHIADLLCVLPDVNITFQVHESSPYTYNIKGGNVPLHNILPHSIYLKHIESIRNSCSYFMDQLISPDGLYLVKWGDRRLHQHIRNKKPRWFIELEKKLLANANSSRRIHTHYQAGVVPPNPSTEIVFNGHFHHNSWAYSWLIVHHCVVIGKTIRSLTNRVIIEHWSQSLSLDNDVSPSAASLTIRKCNGCHLNNTTTIDPRHLPKKYVPNCLISVDKRVVLKLLLVKRIEDTASVGFSHFLLEQTARHRCFTNTPVPNITPPVVPPIQLSPNHQLIDTFIMSSYHVPILRQLSTSLSDTLSPVYYTDGSVNTSQTTAGAAWIETSRHIHLSFHTNLPHDWMISFKSELIAIILTLFVTRETSHVTIYTDSKSVIDKFNALNSEVNRFSSSRHNTKLQYFKYWALLFHLIETLQLKVQLKKVKAHRGNRFNDEVDKLAKAASSLKEGLILNTNNFANIGINFKHIEIEDHLRGFIKTITNVNRFSQFLALNRNSKYRKSDIDWPTFCSIIKGIEASNTISFKYSHHRSKRMKLLLEELPTIEFYKATKPDLYKDSWNCLYCNSNESFNHLWTCSARLSQMNNIISDTKKLLRNTINLVYKADVNLQNNLNFILDHRSWWLPIYDPLHITFVDLIKGIVPDRKSTRLNAITNSKQAITELLGILYDFIYDYCNHYCNERCT